jgi:hypothetical protein
MRINLSLVNSVLYTTSTHAHITHFAKGLNFTKNKRSVFKAQVIASNVGRQKSARF